MLQVEVLMINVQHLIMMPVIDSVPENSPYVHSMMLIDLYLRTSHVGAGLLQTGCHLCHPVSGVRVKFWERF